MHIKTTQTINVLFCRVIFEAQIESDTPYEAKWFKDNLPLNSPDYETRLENHTASLMIEETFSEDTARYTLRVQNGAGEAESSAYLHVKGGAFLNI